MKDKPSHGSAQEASGRHRHKSMFFFLHNQPAGTARKGRGQADEGCAHVTCIWRNRRWCSAVVGCVERSVRKGSNGPVADNWGVLTEYWLAHASPDWKGQDHANWMRGPKKFRGFPHVTYRKDRAAKRLKNYCKPHRHISLRKQEPRLNIHCTIRKRKLESSNWTPIPYPVKFETPQPKESLQLTQSHEKLQA